MVKINLTEQQASLVLRALENESYDDPAEDGEYSYYDCYEDIKKMISKQQ